MLDPLPPLPFLPLLLPSALLQFLSHPLCLASSSPRLASQLTLPLAAKGISQRTRIADTAQRVGLELPEYTTEGDNMERYRERLGERLEGAAPFLSTISASHAPQSLPSPCHNLSPPLSSSPSVPPAPAHVPLSAAETDESRASALPTGKTTTSIRADLADMAKKS